MLKYLSGCVSERENQGLLEYELKNRCYKCWLCVNEPQSYLKYQYSCIYPNLECSYLVIQVGSRGMNDIFGLPRAFVTWDSKLTSPKRPFWSHGGAKHFRRNPSYWDLSHPRWFVPYAHTTPQQSAQWTPLFRCWELYVNLLNKKVND